MLKLAGDVHGRRILDAGCGSGPLSEALQARGAIVTGFDSSPAMIELARKRLGEDADLRVADISLPLPFADGAFDDVVVSLVLHYLEDWKVPLSELRRVLKPGGRLLAVALLSTGASAVAAPPASDPSPAAARPGLAPAGAGARTSTRRAMSCRCKGGTPT
ncbi:class I SAM-dependent methyltransferase [Micromonospora peucetia]|uniref:class I SAM-dependent methyltransferase n=1 Tax=Micromonospora peucetia TaxID=47871 RepID=UPI00332094C2